MAKILIVDDEPRLRSLLCRLLVSEGHLLTEATNGDEALAAALREDFDLILLDLLLPNTTGDDVLATLLKQRPRARVLVVSSVTDIQRRARLLTSGAVDFLAKPFANAELVARVRARLRDTPRFGIQELANSAGLHLDIKRRELLLDGRRVELSNREFVLLAHLLGKRGEVCTRSELLNQVWGFEFDPGTNVVDVCVARLRAKIRGNQIETIRNVGYRLAS